MEDARSFYINQIINHYRKSIFDEPCESVTVTYRFQGDKENSYRIFSHNEGLDVIQDYIKDLEKKVSELQYVEKIIQAARREQL
jgi:hypothetical protein